MTYKAEDFIQAIPGTGGIITKIAARVGCDWRTAKRFVTEYGSVRKVWEAEREGVKDRAEVVIIGAIDAGDIQTAKWYLTVQAQDRGYGDKPAVQINQYPVSLEQWKAQAGERLGQIEGL